MPKLLTNLKIHEVSSVNRGAGHGVKVVMMKRDETSVTNADPTLHELIKGGGGYDDVDAIFTAAAAHGAPAAPLMKAKVALAKVFTSIEKNLAEDDQQVSIEKSLSQCVEHITGLVPAEKRDDFVAACAAIPTVAKGDSMSDKVLDELKKSLDTLVTGFGALATDVTVLKMSTDQQAHYAKLADEPAKKAFREMTPDARAAAVKKAADDECGPDEEMVDGKKQKKKSAGDPVVKVLETTVVDLKKTLDGYVHRDRVAEYKKKAVEIGLTEADGELMLKAYSGDDTAMADFTKKLATANAALKAQVDTGAFFGEFGKTVTVPGGSTAFQEIRAKAEEFRKSDAGKGLSIHQAVAKVVADPFNAELVARNKVEEARRRAA